MIEYNDINEPIRTRTFLSIIDMIREARRALERPEVKAVRLEKLEEGGAMTTDYQEVD